MPDEEVRAAPRTPTIRDVARAAGVSHQTVSRYIRFSGTGVKPGSRERIEAAIATLGYRTNLVARAMRERSTGTIAIVLAPGTATGSLQILEGATGLASEVALRVEVVTVSGNASERGIRLDGLARSGLYDGMLNLISLGKEAGETSLGGCPIEHAPLYDEHMRGVGEVAESAPVAEMITRLVELGHRGFIHIAGDLAHAAARNRRRVYLDTVERLGVDSHGVVVDPEWSGHVGREVALGLPADHSVTAVIAANDVIAAGVIAGARARGWRIPQDMSVTGWDARALSAWLDPALTSVAMDYVGLGRRVMSRLLARLREDIAPMEAAPVARVLWRESTGPSPSRIWPT